MITSNSRLYAHLDQFHRSDGHSLKIETKTSSCSLDAVKDEEKSKTNTQAQTLPPDDCWSSSPNRKLWSRSIFSFVESNTRLLDSCSQCIRCIRMASSVHLGLGHKSFSVIRVEDAAVGRHIRTMKGSHSNGVVDNTISKMSVLTVKRAREAVFNAMRDQGKSIVSVLQLLMRVVVKDDDYNDDEFYQLVKRGDELTSADPMFITLSFLNAYIHHLCELVTQTVSIIWVALCDHPSYAEEIVADLTRKNMKSEERLICLQWYFPPQQWIEKCHITADAAVSLPSMETQSKKLDQRTDVSDETMEWVISRLREQLELSMLNLWMFEQSGVSEGLKFEELGMGIEPELDHGRNVSQSCWKRLSHSIKSTNTLCHDLDKALLSSWNEGKGNKEATGKNDCGYGMGKKEPQSISEEYCNNDVVLLKEESKSKVEQNLDPHQNNQTLVYSAQGTMTSRQNKYKVFNKKKENTNQLRKQWYLPPPSMMFQEPTSRTMFLRELQSRLQAIKGIMNDGHDDDKSGRNVASSLNFQEDNTREAKNNSVCADYQKALLHKQAYWEEKDSIATTPLSFGMSSCFLMELQNSIHKSITNHDSLINKNDEL